MEGAREIVFVAERAAGGVRLAKLRFRADMEDDGDAAGGNGHPHMRDRVRKGGRVLC